MPTIEELPEDFVLPNRDDIAERYRRDYKLRLEGAKVGEGTLAHADSLTNADTLLPVYALVGLVAKNTTLKNATSKKLEEMAERRGLPKRLAATGSSGFVEIDAAVGGVFIDTTRTLKHAASGTSAHCAVAATYFDGDPVPIKCDTTGAATELPAETVLTWQNPPAGLGESAPVVATSTGKGLTGGRDQETDDGIRARISDHDANPPAAGNDAEVRELVKAACDALGTPVEEVFVYPCVAGPGTYAFCFTLRPGNDNISRLPSSIQIAAVIAAIKGSLPGDDGIFPCTILGEDLNVYLKIRWAKGADGWLDPVPYPVWDEADPAYVSSVTSATVFRVVSMDDPAVGKTIAFYDPDNRKFIRKRILTATSLGSNAWDIVCDTTSGATDTSYQPVLNDTFCPWSESLDLLITPIITEVNKLGPGEQFDEADLFDEDGRLRRDPPDHPQTFPMELTLRTISPLYDLSQVAGVDVYSPEPPTGPTTGAPGVSSNMLVLNRILAFP